MVIEQRDGLACGCVDDGEVNTEMWEEDKWVEFLWRHTDVIEFEFIDMCMRINLFSFLFLVHFFPSSTRSPTAQVTRIGVQEKNKKAVKWEQSLRLVPLSLV